MKNTGLSGEYIFWMRDEFFYKYGVKFFIPTCLVNLFLWYSFSFLGEWILSISIYLIYFFFSFFRLFTVLGLPNKKSWLKPFIVSLLLFVLSFSALLACLFTEIRGPYSDLLWGNENRKLFSWSFLMSGAFGLVYLGTGYFKAAYINFKDK